MKMWNVRIRVATCCIWKL